MERRTFIRNGALTVAGLAMSKTNFFAAPNLEKVRLGYIGVGARGMSHISAGALRDDIEIVAICDTQESSLKICRAFLAKKGRPAATEYTGGLDAYKIVG